MGDIIKYKELNNGKTNNIAKKIIKNNINSIVLKDHIYMGYLERKSNDINILNITIDFSYKIPHVFISEPHYFIQNTNAKNIYFKNYPNLGGLTIPFEKLLEKRKYLYKIRMGRL